MRKKSDDFYDKYKDFDITFNQNIIDSLGLVTDQISFKCGGDKIPCIIYSSTMAGARLIAKLEEPFFAVLRKQRNTLVLRYTFHINNQKQDISFIINSKLKNYNKYNSDKKNYYFLNVEYINKPPDILIDIIGTHITEQISSQKRMEERIVLSSGNEEALGLKIMENFLFISGNGKKCVLTEISIFSAKVLINGKNGDFIPGARVLLLMKAKGLEGVGEMIGSIDRVELINESEGFYSVIITFNQEMVPPTYKLWIAECIELIKIKPVKR